ncbi:MAG: hypothetical protein QXW86_08870 [Saccharolobus sp.]|uniref:hypothetical protein n=1 Tax=Saccharolobus sp. TaxID=2100761 RepID=UPI00317389C8
MAYGKHPVWTDRAPWYIEACKKRKHILDHVWRWLNLSQPFSQSETIDMVNNIKGMMIMA